MDGEARSVDPHERLSFLFNRSQRPECCFLTLCQSFRTGNIHPFVGSVASQCAQARTGLYIPEFDRSIITANGNGLPIRIEGHRPNLIDMTLQGLEALPAAHLPHAHLLIKASSGKSLPIGAEGDRPYLTGVALQGLEALPIAHVPQAYGLVPTA